MTNWSKAAIILLALGCLRTAAWAALAQDVYVWQRAWTPEVNAAVRERGARFAHLVALSAELSWEAGNARVARAQLDYESLKAAGVPVGLALRVGPCPASLMREATTPDHLAALAAALVAEARAAQLEPAELQLDFDCAESKLDLYRGWVAAIRAKIAPVPLIITVLPCWLERKEFAELASATDGIVLQVHSIELPKNPDEPFSLCDPHTARSAVEKAAGLGVPFRIALPTYGYVLAFSAKGKYIGLSADGPLKTWPAGSRLVGARADAPGIATLVRCWTDQPPKNLQGFIWYRLPVEQQAMNWPWETLQAVMQGRAPRAQLSIKVRRNGDGLAEIDVANVGEADLPIAAVDLKWKEARLLAADGLNGYELIEGEPGAAQLRPLEGTVWRMLPGQTRIVGWLRLDRDVEVTTHVLP